MKSILFDIYILGIIMITTYNKSIINMDMSQTKIQTKSQINSQTQHGCNNTVYTIFEIINIVGYTLQTSSPSER